MRLFLRIFLSFWLAQALFLVLAILVTVAMRPTRRISEIEALLPKTLDDAVATYQTGGPGKLRDYLRTYHDTRRVHAMLFDEHGPLQEGDQRRIPLERDTAIRRRSHNRAW